MKLLRAIFQEPPGFYQSALQLMHDTYSAIIMSSSKTATNWKKQLVFRSSASNVLINSQNKTILCWGQVIGEVCHWVPIEFKTPEAAQEWINDGSIPELKRSINAPVEWRKELIGPIPPIDSFQNINITSIPVSGTPNWPTANAPVQTAQAPAQALPPDSD